MGNHMDCTLLRWLFPWRGVVVVRKCRHLNVCLSRLTVLSPEVHTSANQGNSESQPSRGASTALPAEPMFQETPCHRPRLAGPPRGHSVVPYCSHLLTVLPRTTGRHGIQAGSGSSFGIHLSPESRSEQLASRAIISRQVSWRSDAKSKERETLGLAAFHVDCQLR